jgi:hypothetical protein
MDSRDLNSLSAVAEFDISHATYQFFHIVNIESSLSKLAKITSFDNI